MCTFWLLHFWQSIKCLIQHWYITFPAMQRDAQLLLIRFQQWPLLQRLLTYWHEQSKNIENQAQSNPVWVISALSLYSLGEETKAASAVPNICMCLVIWCQLHPYSLSGVTHRPCLWPISGVRRQLGPLSPPFNEANLSSSHRGGVEQMPLDQFGQRPIMTSNVINGAVWWERHPLSSWSLHWQSFNRSVIYALQNFGSFFYQRCRIILK